MKNFSRQDYKYKQLRRARLRKDKYTCQRCGSKSNLTIHHITNFTTDADHRYDIGNVVTLCEHCHTTFHKVYGYTNNNREQLNDFIKFYHRRKNSSAQRLSLYNKRPAGYRQKLKEKVEYENHQFILDTIRQAK